MTEKKKQNIISKVLSHNNRKPTTPMKGGILKMECLNAGIVQSVKLLGLGVPHGTSTKSLGNMSFARDHDGHAERNLGDVFRRVGIREKGNSILFLNLTHSANVALVKKVEKRSGRIVLSQESPEIISLSKSKGIDPPRDFIPNPEEGIDACISKSEDLFLAILPADCAPVFLYDPVTQYYGIVHAGVLGVFSGIVPHTVECMREWAGSTLEDIECYVGPCISSRMYQLQSSGLWKTILQDRVSLHDAENFDLKQNLKMQLLKVGLIESRIQLSDFCTGSDTELFFSNYSAKTAEEKNKQGRVVSLIGRR